jgi:hypothetical protein
MPSPAATSSEGYRGSELDYPTGVTVTPLVATTDEQTEVLNVIPVSPYYLEIGIRVLLNVFVVGDEARGAAGGWTVLREGRYRYAVAEPEEPPVRIVPGEYFAVKWTWSPAGGGPAFNYEETDRGK